LLRFSAGEELRGLDFCAPKMGTFLLSRVTKALQSYPGACKDIFRINLKMGKSIETNPTNCCRQPKNREIIGIKSELIGRTNSIFSPARQQEIQR
jgi:hypothetical protein